MKVRQVAEGAYAVPSYSELTVARSTVSYSNQATTGREPDPVIDEPWDHQEVMDDDQIPEGADTEG